MNYRFEFRCTNPEPLPADLLTRIVRQLEILLEGYDFDDIDGTCDQLPGDVEDVVSGRWIRLEAGEVQAHKNEVSIVATDQDPAGVRVASGSIGPGIGHFSFNVLRPDGRQEMIAWIQGKRWEPMRHRGFDNLFGELELWVRDPRLSESDDQQFIKRFAVDPQGSHFYGAVFVDGRRVA